MKNQQLQGDEKEETAEEDIMDGTEIEEEVEELHTAYILADI